ncbi:aspartate aminotransferase family protein [Sporanaerobium hydrogeniformans]|uniref:Aspartate aminotransferase family protein n=1 Tax=Sporanaerobium hydrogeniformans TaxID=3072179 RepID=A0AC61D9V0_9FIRM|nr:aspartate aminotransferase family protein [Sporanaerobium hydrogeniformans]PHV69506.1 aspartate aminotransferase family protein [Sporanaerobium hydrogeniformans]
MSVTILQGQKYIMNTYSRFPLSLIKGEGVYVYDETGKKYLDMCAGIAVNALGYGHKGLSEALKKQVDELLHISNLYYTPQQVEAARLLVENSPFAKAFFCNSGAEANEAALKLAKKFGKTKSATCNKVVTMEHSFHGRTYGALGATGQMKYQKSFTPMLPGYSYAQYNDFNSLKALVDEDTCAVLLEVIQGEGGIIPGQKEYLQAVEALCKEKNILFMIDEVQTGMGRTGKLFAFENFAIQPDVVTLAKGLGGGVPIGAMLCNEKADVFEPADHASTFGGNPLATTAAAVVLKELLETPLLKQVKKVGNYLEACLKELQREFSCIKEVRGMGLMQGIELTIPVKEVVTLCMEKGMLVVGSGLNVVRFVPPLIISKAEVDEAIDILKKVLSKVN